MRRRPYHKLTVFTLLLAVSFLLTTASVLAYQGSGGELITGQPSFGNITAAGGKLTYSYNLNDARAVTLQAIGEVAQPTITILQNGQPVAAQQNAEGSNIVSLTALLNPGTYAIEVSTVNNTTGTIIVVVQSETAVTTGQLPIASVVTGQVTVDSPVATYTFTALFEPVFFYVENILSSEGATIHLRNITTGTESVIIGSGVSGTRFRIPAGSSAYEVQLTFSGTSDPQPFTLCLTLVSASSCEAGGPPPQSNDAGIPAVTPDVSFSTDCVVTPQSANGANIRQTADTASPVLVGLPSGEVASVTGISPNGTFFHILYKNTKGWVAQIAVTSSGDCSAVPVVNPPLFIPAPTPVPPTSVPPTHVPTPSGPCLIKITNDVLVYTQPNAIPDYIFDQVHAGYELVPVGKLADNSWWKTNYSNAWIQTNHFNHEAHVSGNCHDLPVVSH